MVKMSLTIGETRNALAQVALPSLHQRTKLETLFTKMISDQEAANELLSIENEQLQQRKIAFEIPSDQTAIEALESEISQLEKLIEQARAQEQTLTLSIAQKKETYTRRVTQNERTQALRAYARYRNW